MIPASIGPTHVGTKAAPAPPNGEVLIPVTKARLVSIGARHRAASKLRGTVRMLSAPRVSSPSTGSNRRPNPEIGEPITGVRNAS